MNKTNLCIASLVLLLMIGQISAQDHLWKFDENQGNIAYDSRGGRRGRDGVRAFLNNAFWRKLAKIGPGSAVRITGADNSFVTFGDSIGQFGRNDFTVAFWVQTADTLGLYDLIGNRADPGHGNWFAVRMTGDGYVTAEVDEDSNGTNYIGVRSVRGGLNDDQWHHITVTRNGGNLNLYIDGALSNRGSARGTANIRNRNDFKLGRSMVERSTRRFAPAALFDDVAIYSDDLTASQVRSLYRSGLNN